MNILLVEPYDTGSHAAWAEGYRRHSQCQVDILRLAGANWKWRMHGGAITLARRFNESDFTPDLVLATDMLDVTTFQALTRHRTADVPFVLYFHENQLSYPWSPTDRDVLKQRDRHYGFINYASAMACDAVYFNSRYHLESFFDELVRMLKHFPDHNELGSVKELRARSAVLPLGLDLRRLDDHAESEGEGRERPLVVWNHRWEYDKNPSEFFDILIGLAERDVAFEVAVLGENFSQEPRVFDDARKRLATRVVHYGYAESFADYAAWLHAADVIPVTSNQDFFGASVVEAVYCRTWPLLPRRLAYPELVPAEMEPSVFYDGREDLSRRLEETLLAGGRSPLVPALRDHVARFDWTIVAPLYDDTFGSLR